MNYNEFLLVNSFCLGEMTHLKKGIRFQILHLQPNFKNGKRTFIYNIEYWAFLPIFE